MTDKDEVRVKVRDFMTPSPLTLDPNMEVMDAVAALVKRGVSGAPVVDKHGTLTGIMTERDCLKVCLTASYHGERGGKVSEFMTHEVRPVEADAPLINVVEMFVNVPYKRYPVVERNRLVGIISRRDAMKALLKYYR